MGLRSLEPGTFWGYGPAIAVEPTLLRVGDVATKHLRIGELSATVPPAPEAVREAFVRFAASIQASGVVGHRSLSRIIEQLDHLQAIGSIRPARKGSTPSACASSRESPRGRAAQAAGLAAAPLDALIRLERRVSYDGLVAIGGKYYSVPDWTRRLVEVHQLANEIRVLDGAASSPAIR